MEAISIAKAMATRTWQRLGANQERWIRALEISSAVVGVTLQYQRPQAILAAVIIMAAINLVKVDPVKHARKVQRHDAAVAVITFVLTIIRLLHLD